MSAPHRVLRLDAEALRRALPGASADDLDAAMSHPDLDEEHVALITRNRSVRAALLQRIASDPRWVRAYGVKAGLVRNAHTPRAVAMSLAKMLFWRDLALVAEDVYVAPPVRRLAERLLVERLPEMAVGERMALARLAGRALFGAILALGEPPVVEALLWNGRLTEADAAAAAGDPAAPAALLETIGRHPRWSDSYSVRLALVRNARTPLAVALGFLTALREADLRAVAAQPTTPLIVGLAIERILASGRAP